MVDGGAEEHEVLVALLDDLAGAGRDRVVGARLGLEGDDLLLLRPRPGRRRALGLHGQVREGRHQVGRRAGVGRAQVEHVPGPAVVEGRAVGGRGRVVLPGLAQFQHRPLLLPVDQVLAGGQAPPASPWVPPRRSACSRCRPPRTPTRRVPRGCRIGQGRPRAGARHRGLGHPGGTSQPDAHHGTSRQAERQRASPWASGSAQTRTAAVARGRWATWPGRGPWDRCRARRSSRPIPGRRGSSSPSRGPRRCRSGPSGSDRRCRPAPSGWR